MDLKDIVLPRKDLVEQAQPVSGSTPEATLLPPRAEVPESRVAGRGALLITSTTFCYRVHVSSEVARYNRNSKAAQGCRGLSRLGARQPVGLGRLVLDLCGPLGAKQDHRLLWGATRTLAATSRQQRRFQGDKRGGHDPCNGLGGSTGRSAGRTRRIRTAQEQLTDRRYYDE